MCPWGSREVGWERAAHGGCVREQAPLWAARAWSPSRRPGLYMGHALQLSHLRGEELGYRSSIFH